MMRWTIQCHHETGENAPVEYSDTGRRCLYQRTLADRCFACRNIIDRQVALRLQRDASHCRRKSGKRWANGIKIVCATISAIFFKKDIIYLKNRQKNNSAYDRMFLAMQSIFSTDGPRPSLFYIGATRQIVLPCL